MAFGKKTDRAGLQAVLELKKIIQKIRRYSSCIPVW